MQWIFDSELPSGAKSYDNSIDKLLAPQNETSISERAFIERQPKIALTKYRAWTERTVRSFSD